MTYAAKYAAFFDRVMIPPYGWARSKKALVAKNVATATDYYKEADLDGQIILLVNTYNGDTYEGIYDALLKYYNRLEARIVPRGEDLFDQFT